MWIVCLVISAACLILSVVLSTSIGNTKYAKNHKFNILHGMLAGVFLAAVFMFYPVHYFSFEKNIIGIFQSAFLSLFNSMQIFGMGCEFAVIKDSMYYCPVWLRTVYQAWASLLFIIAPIFTFSFVLSMFKNLSAYIRYLICYGRDVYVFSELNEKSLALASDIRNKKGRVSIVFTDVFDGNDENSFELVDEAKKLGAIMFKKDILAINFNKHSGKSTISLFAIGNNETDNLNQSLKLIEIYRDRENTNLYVFSVKVDSQILISSADKGVIKVRRINEVRSLVNRVLYERSDMLFKTNNIDENGDKRISAVVVGMGRHGTEMVKALAWFCQMDGYSLEINAFDKDPLAKDKFTFLAPELMSGEYERNVGPGEAQYIINIHSGFDAQTDAFVKKIKKLSDATYVFVCLGNDDINIDTAVNLRMQFKRMGIDPIIQAVVYNSQQKKALEGLTNYKSQAYNIDFIGDIESSYSDAVVIDSELEEEALQRHMKYPNSTEASFWNYEYNYMSSIASAIHLKARIACGIPGAAKTEDELTPEEAERISRLEHRRWNAYVRGEGYIYSGSRNPETRDDLAKMHHDLVAFKKLDEGERKKDLLIGTVTSDKK